MPSNDEKRKQYLREWYAKNRDKVLEKTHARRAENPEKERERDRKRYHEKRKHSPEYKAGRAAYYQAHRGERIAQVATYKKAHPEQYRSYGQISYRRNPERWQATQARYRAKHPEREHARHAKYRAENIEKERARVRIYYKAHPEISSAAYKRRRAAKLNAPINDFTAEQWVEMQAVYDYRCVYCGKRYKGHLTQDHITPLSNGGSHTRANIVPACRSCNSKKNAGNPPIPVQPLLL